MSTGTYSPLPVLIHFLQLPQLHTIVNQ